MKQFLLTVTKRALVAVMPMLAIVAPTQAEVIIIGKGTGIVWEGLPFSQTLSGGMVVTQLQLQYGLLAVSNSANVCMQSNQLQTIGGYLAYPLPGVPGVGLIPRAVGSATYVTHDIVYGDMKGNIGLPQTSGTGTFGALTSSPGYEWCLPPSMTEQNPFYHISATRRATLSGTWVMVADGTQQAGQALIPPMYFASFSAFARGDRSVVILPSNITLRISTLECTINTPLTINFGGVLRNTQVNAELASRSVPFIVNCGQSSNFIDANINVQLRAVSGLFGGAPTRLALSQGGGYITGEIDYGITGSGACTATTGLRFDSTPVKIGNIYRQQSSTTTSNQLTWRLCSGGDSLPSGAVTASTEMLVTFN